MQKAEQAYRAGTYPIGAIIVDPKGKIIGQGYNHVYSQGDFTSHAEIEAIRSAGKRLMKGPNLNSCTLYTTMEPCLMCCGAILLARIKCVFWVIDDDLHGALRRLCKNIHSPSVDVPVKSAAFDLPKSNFSTHESVDEPDKYIHPFENDYVSRNSNANGLTALSLLPIGYMDRITSLSIFPACEHDLKQRMGDLMDDWNAAKPAKLSEWK